MRLAIIENEVVSNIILGDIATFPGYKIVSHTANIGDEWTPELEAEHQAELAKRWLILFIR